MDRKILPSKMSKSLFLKPKSTAILLAALITLSATPVFADENAPIPYPQTNYTLNELKNDTKTFLDGTHGKYTLSTEQGENTAHISLSVKNADGTRTRTTYYYTPSESDKFLKNLGGMGHFLVETTESNALYELDGKFYTFDTENMRESAYELTETPTKTLTSITTYVYNPSTKQLTEKYYDVSLNKTEYGTGDSTKTFGWVKVDADGNEIENPDDATELKFKENPSNPIGQTITAKYDSTNLGTRVTSGTGGANIVNNFVGLGGSASGGAISNEKGTIGNITGDFVGNYVVFSGTVSDDKAQGGAISNEKGTIGDIVGDFIGNYVVSSGTNSNVTAYGGAIYNNTSYLGTATIGNITGDFIGNYASSTGSNAIGGAIYNYSGGTIGDITGDFIGNYASGKYVYGGAIYSEYYGKIGNITGDFIGNFASGSNAIGGAIYNYAGTIGDITGDFIGNYASASSSAKGGAIYNGSSGTIGDITADFIGNFASGSYAYGGTIYNDYSSAKIGDITNDFIGNYASSTYQAKGGAIYNSGTIGDITGDFVGNYASSAFWSYNSFVQGGAIYNSRTIGNITGDFIGNYASGSYTNGGAIDNSGYSTKIGDITGDFIGNYVSAKSSAHGGAIYNEGKIGALDASNNLVGGIYGSFINNYAETTSSINLALGGAVYTEKDMNFIAEGKDIEFSGNYTEDYRGKINNAIFVYNTSTSTNPTLTFKTANSGTVNFLDSIDGGNTTTSDEKTIVDHSYTYNINLSGDGTGSVRLYGDVINANVAADNVTVDFANGETRDYEFVTLTDNGNTKYNFDFDLSTGKSDTVTTTNASTGAITLNILNFFGDSTDETIKFQVLHTQNDDLYLTLGDNIKIVGSDLSFVENILENIPDVVYNDEIYAQQGGLDLTSTDTYNDTISVVKEKIYDGLVLINQKEGDRTFEFRTTDNYLATQDLGTTAQGTFNINGLAPQTPSTLNLKEQNGFIVSNDTTINLNNIILTNNKEQKDLDGNITQEANNNPLITIEKDAQAAVITLNNSTLDGKIASETKYELNITGESTLKDTIGVANVNIGTTDDSQNTILSLTDANFFENADVTMHSGTLNLINNQTQDQLAQSFNINGNINLFVDADLANAAMDRLPENTTVANDAFINVNKINLLSDSKDTVTNIPFAYDSFKNSVNYVGESQLSNKTQSTTMFAPIYKYDVTYDPENGFFTFVRGAGAPQTSSEAFTPAVLQSPVATQAGAFTTQMQTFSYAFQHSDNFMNIPYLERISIKNQNKYAISPTGNATDMGTFSPLLTKHSHDGFWVKPYASFENIPLKNGPKVSNINYGTLIGYDTEIKELKHGVDRVITGYIGYNGASQRYSGVDTYQNGGILGSTTTFYKGNFFNATTISVGASSGSSSSNFGSENYAMLLAGIGNKTGYNIEIKDGRFIFQPAMLLSYTFVNTFDYTNAAGVKINSDPLHAIQLAPGMKFIMNTKNGWQPYLGVNMVWNILDKQKVMANDTRLPEMSIKPYVEYGIGLQRCFKNDGITAYSQAMIHNGGRNGVSLTFGMRWKLGKSKIFNKFHPSEKL